MSARNGLSCGAWATWRSTFQAMGRGYILWGERMYQHKLGNDATAPWEYPWKRVNP